MNSRHRQTINLILSIAAAVLVLYPIQGAKAQTLTSARVRSLDHGNSVWDTEPSPWWLLAVTKDDRYLNPNDQQIAVSLATPGDYSFGLQATTAPDGSFFIGYALDLYFDGSQVPAITVTSTVATPGTTPPISGTLFFIKGELEIRVTQMRLAQTTNDVVGSYAAVPDGFPDYEAELALTVTHIGSPVLAGARLRGFDGSVWDTFQNLLWILAIRQNGSYINSNDEGVAISLVNEGTYTLGLRVTTQPPANNFTDYALDLYFGTAASAGIIATSTVARLGTTPSFSGLLLYRTENTEVSLTALRLEHGTNDEVGQYVGLPDGYPDYEGEIVLTVKRIPFRIYPAAEICWESETKKQYQLQWAESLSATNWNDFGPRVRGTGDPICVFDSTRSHAKRYFRLQTFP